MLTVELLFTDARIDYHALVGKQVTFKIIYILLLNLTSPAFLVCVGSEDKKMLSSGSMHYLNEDEIDYYKKKSLEGNSDASFKLYQYYAFSNFIKPEMIKWLKISALQGNDVARYNYAVYLINKGDMIEASKLIDEIQSSGDAASANELREKIK